MFDKRLNIFVGHYGSGKSELSVNCALALSKSGDDVIIADLDIVNPFFRSSDAKEVLKKNNIELISTLYANTNVDVPAVPGAVSSLFSNPSKKVIMDIGGDDAGAKVLGRCKSDVFKEEHDIFFIINVLRPMTNNVEKIVKIISEIETASGLKITKLVNNTNLLEQTDIIHIQEGERILGIVSEKIGIPFAFTAIMEDNYNRCKEDLIDKELFIMKKNIRLPFVNE